MVQVTNTHIVIGGIVLLIVIVLIVLLFSANSKSRSRSIDLKDQAPKVTISDNGAVTIVPNPMGSLRSMEIDPSARLLTAKSSVYVPAWEKRDKAVPFIIDNKTTLPFTLSLVDPKGKKHAILDIPPQGSEKLFWNNTSVLKNKKQHAVLFNGGKFSISTTEISEGTKNVGTSDLAVDGVDPKSLLLIEIVSKDLINLKTVTVQ